MNKHTKVYVKENLYSTSYTLQAFCTSTWKLMILVVKYKNVLHTYEIFKKSDEH